MLHPLHPRYWRLRTQVTVVILIVGLAVAGAFLGALIVQDKGTRNALKTSAPVIGVVIGLFSLVITAASTTGNWVRQRREATINAYIAWSATTVEARRTLTRVYGPGPLTEEQGKDLVRMKHDGTIPKRRNTAAEKELASKRAEAASALVLLMNGLERIAVGVIQGVYDLQTVRALGGTIIIRTWERGETYAQARRTADDPEARQARAYISLEYVAGLLAHNVQREVDKGRLSALRKKSGT